MIKIYNLTTRTKTSDYFYLNKTFVNFKPMIHLMICVTYNINCQNNINIKYYTVFFRNILILPLKLMIEK